jgi:hypothetical protein
MAFAALRPPNPPPTMTTRFVAIGKGSFHKMSLRKSILVLLFFYLASCGGNTTTISSTTQTLSNQGLQFITALAQQVQNNVSGVSDCGSFQGALNQLVGTENCSGGGTKSQGVSQITCMDSPSLLGEATLSFNFQGCQEPGQTLGGTVQMDLAWDGSVLTAKIQSSDFSFNGLFYSIQNLTITVDAAGQATCTGVLLVQGDLCGVSSDCNFCPL